MLDPEDDRVGRALAAWVQWVLRHCKLVTLAGVLLGALALAYAATHLGINTDTADMISPDLGWRQSFIEYRETFPARDRNLIVVVDADSEASAESFATLLADRLRAQRERYRSVFLAGAGDFFEQHGLMYLPLEDLQALADRLAAAQPLLGQLKGGLDGTTLVGIVQEAIRRPEGEGEAREALTRALAGSVEGANRGERHPISWRALLQDAPDAAGRRYLLLQPVLEFDRPQPAARAIAAVRQAAAAIQEETGVDARVRLTGTVAMEHEELGSVARGAGTAGLLTLTIVMVVLYLALGSLTMLASSLLTLIVGLACTAAFAALTVGQLNLLSAAFAVLYVGLGVDFILHLSMRTRELWAAGAPMKEAIVCAVRSVGSSLVLCAVTTAAGFYAFIPTAFSGVSELGLIAGTGMFISLLVSLTLLPALMAQFQRGWPRREHRIAALGWGVLATLSARHRTVLFCAAAIVVAALVSLPKVRFDSDPMHLRNPDSESVATLRELAADGQAVPMHLVALAADRTAAQAWTAALESLPSVRSVRTVDTLVPKDQEQKKLTLEEIQLLMGPGFADLERAAPDPAALERALRDLLGVLRAQTRPSVEQQALAEGLDALFDTLALLPQQERDARLESLEEALIGELPATLRRLEAGLFARPFGREALPAEIKERWIGREGQELLEIVPAEDVSENAAARRFIDAVRGVVDDVTGLPVVHEEASRTVIRAFQLAFVYALAIITLVLWTFRLDLRDTLSILAPVVTATAVTAGMTVWLDIQFNYANIVALPLLLGVGLDSGIHIVQRAKAEGIGRLLHTSTSSAVLACGLTTLAGFGSLAFSAHIGMASLGVLLTVGMGATLVATLLVLPAWMGWLR